MAESEDGKKNELATSEGLAPTTTPSTGAPIKGPGAATRPTTSVPEPSMRLNETRAPDAGKPTVSPMGVPTTSLDASIRSAMSEPESGIDPEKIRTSGLPGEPLPLRVQLLPTSSPAKNPLPITNVLKEQFALFALLVTYVGIVSLEAYYRQFGVRYQFLGIPVTHVVFRGLTSVYDSPYLLTPYVLATIWLWVDQWAGQTQQIAQFLRWRTGFSHVLIFSLLVLTYPLAFHAGVVDARRDMAKETSTLPRLVRLTTADEAFSRSEGYRVFFVGTDTVMIFVPVPFDSIQSISPHMRLFSKGAVNGLEFEN